MGNSGVGKVMRSILPGHARPRPSVYPDGREADREGGLPADSAKGPLSRQTLAPLPRERVQDVRDRGGIQRADV
ncbi:hypothetical protein GCM10023336_01400 [Streptomyces similanensis]|uniref:Uncharacterized protein n=1 Tax=Streptomyces similanensis TaxID=1274988 RepID=A0ABP9JQT0_9ACTN